MKIKSTPAFILVFAIVLFASFVVPPKKIYDLAKLQRENKLQLFQRSFIDPSDKAKSSVRLDEKEGEGIAWVNGATFSEGTIEIDLKGKDELQKSFLGIAFHALNDSTYDAVYFRPFNFHAKDSVRRIHAVQYISHPAYTWKKLRAEKNAQFEKAVLNAPDPNNWFHAKIEVKGQEVKVYVNEAITPTLTVTKLSNRRNGKIGIWVGDGAGGEFANLAITKAK